MAEPQDPESEQSPYLRLPWPAVASALALLIVLGLGVGVYANRTARPQAMFQPLEQGTVERAGAEARAAPGATAGPEPRAAPEAAAPPEGPGLFALTPAPEATATVTAVPIVNTQPTVQPTAESTATPAPSPIEQVTAPPAPTVAPTVSPELRQEIGDAYAHYWQVRAEALFDLDTSRLEEVMGGDHLAAVQERIEELRADGQAINTDVDHRYAIVTASPTDAQIDDTFVDQSVYVDLQSHSPISVATGHTLRELYILTKLDGTWKVVDLVRYPT